MNESFADFLQTQCALNQMEFAKDSSCDALHSVQIDRADEPAEIAPAVAAMVCARGAIARFLGTSAFADLVRPGATNIRQSPAELAGALHRIALRYAHNRVGGFHLILSIMETHQHAMEHLLAPFVDAYQKNYPNGSLAQQRMKKMMLQFSDPVMASDLEFMVQGTPYDVSRLREQVDFYLGSRFHPYDAEKWKLFLESDDTTRNDPLLLRAFVAQGWETLSAHATSAPAPRSTRPIPASASSRGVGKYRKVRRERGLLDATLFTTPADVPAPLPPTAATNPAAVDAPRPA